MYKFKLIATILTLALMISGCVSQERVEQQEKPLQFEQAEEPVVETVYIAPYGTRYHSRATCAGKNAMPIAREDLAPLYQPCMKCME